MRDVLKVLGWLAASFAILVGGIALLSLLDLGSGHHHYHAAASDSSSGSDGWNAGGGGGWNAGSGGDRRLDPLEIEDTLVVTYCSYSPVSAAQEQHCEDTVGADDIIDLDTPAADARSG